MFGVQTERNFMVIPIKAVNVGGRPVITNVIAGDSRTKGDSVIRVSEKDLMPIVTGLRKLGEHFNDLIRRSGHPNFGK